MIDKLLETFLEESAELLDGLEAELLALEADPSDFDNLNAAFRVLHSLKGSAGMFGFEEVGKFAHQVETALDHFRTDKLPATRELIDAVLSSRDLIQEMIKDPGMTAPPEDAELVQNLKRLAGIADAGGSHAPKPPSAPQAETKQDESQKGEASFLVKYAPSSNVYKRGTKPESLVREVAALGRATIHADCSAIPQFSRLDPEECALSWTIMLTTAKTQDDIKDVFIFEEHDSDITIEEVPESHMFEKGEVKRLGEILESSSNVKSGDISNALKNQKTIGEILVEQNMAEPKHINDALLKQKHARNANADSKEDIEKKSIRIRSDKLDALLNLVGELVTVQAQLSQTVKNDTDRRLQGITDYIKRLSGELRTTAMEMRLIPVDTLFAKYRRMIRDLARDLGKEIEIQIEGGETELDKSVLESLNDPLVHLVRNSADHGIEPPLVREQAGKPKTGTVTISARHAGSFVRISVRDDGAGVDRERVHRKAVEKGVIAPDAQLTPQEIDMLIFAPGFSTAEKISSVSGRGVGLDVVKTAIDQLGGTITLESEKGKGSEFILDIPLTLAIIDGFLARTDTRMFVVPLSQVDSCFERKSVKEKERLLFHEGEFIPFIDSREFFSIDAKETESEEILIARVFDSKVAIRFDQLIGGYQTVIKPIGEISHYAKGVSGAAILADGGIALIVDTLGMARAYREHS